MYRQASEFIVVPETAGLSEVQLGMSSPNTISAVLSNFPQVSPAATSIRMPTSPSIWRRSSSPHRLPSQSQRPFLPPLCKA